MPATNHGKRRAQERAGITAGTINKMTKRIYKHGIKHSETIGELKRFMDYFYLKKKNINNTRLYGDTFYLFHNAILITTIPVPKELLDNLDQYVTEEAMIKYKQFKESKHKCKKEQCIKNKIKQEEV